MPELPAELPNDIEELKAIIRAQAARYDAELHEVYGQLLWEKEKARALQARLFGRKSEKIITAKDIQQHLFNEAECYAVDSPPPIPETTVAGHTRKNGGRKPKISILPTVEKIHTLSDEERSCACCGELRPIIGDERTSEYDLIPEHVMKIIHIRNKYGPCTCEASAISEEKAIVIAPGPAKIIPGSDFTNRTTAFFMTGKYADAIPFYRMEKILARAGLIVTRAALSKQAISVGRAIGDLTDLMNKDLMESPVILMDETTVQVLNDDNSGKNSYMWVMCGYHDGKPIHRFAWHSSRSGSFAENLLKGYKGFYLQTDGFDGYNRFDGRGDLVHVGCFAHIRRKFVNAWEIAGKTGISKTAIDLIAKLYRVESELRVKLDSQKIDPATFMVRRKTAVEPIIAALRQWLMDASLTVAPQSALGKAISYAQHIFPRAIRYVDHPLLKPDTNVVENAIRPFVIGRKNWLFSGCALGAHASAAIYSLIETAKANGHDPYHYLCFVFDRLPMCKSDIEKRALLPYNITPEILVQMRGN